MRKKTDVKNQKERVVYLSRRMLVERKACKRGLQKFDRAVRRYPDGRYPLTATRLKTLRDSCWLADLFGPRLQLTGRFPGCRYGIGCCVNEWRDGRLVSNSRGG